MNQWRRVGFMLSVVSLLIGAFSIRPHVKAESHTGSVPDPLSERVVDYKIQVTLDANKKKLIGLETVTWRNPGRNKVDELFFHLYPNAFASDKSTFNKESGGQLRDARRDDSNYGDMNILSMKTQGGQDLMPTLQYVQPDDHNDQDRTVASVTLPEAVPADGTTTVQIQFEVTLPKVYARMGYYGDFVMAGQWFPKLAVYEPVGRRGVIEEGWNAHQYHGNSEFYADYGTFDVSINVPKKYIVAASGAPTASAPAPQSNGTATWHFKAEDVHDFAWSASPNFITDEKDFTSANVAGVKIKLYLDPNHKQLRDRYFKAAENSLNLYGKWYGSYPYTTLSIITPPAGAEGAGGMEYPTLVTAWEASNSKLGEELERVIVHEIGHQYWYGLVGTNEFEEAWLDEGFTSYAEDKVMQTAYGAKSYLPYEGSFITHPEPLAYPSWSYANYDSYAANVYTRAKLALFSIERQVGEPMMRAILHSYFERWKFRHPTTSDFKRSVEEATGKDWTAFFQQYVFDGKMVDYEIKDIQVRKLMKQGKTEFESIVLVQRLGGRYAPIPIQFNFSDGSKLMKNWNGQEDKIRFRVVKNVPLQSAIIDPSYSITLENRHINNYMTAAMNENKETWWSSWSANLLQIFAQSFGW